VLHALAADEVEHARLGWAYLATEAAAGATAFLAPLVPAMLRGSAPAAPSAPDAPEDAAALLAAGVLPSAEQREVFACALDEVVFPGLERCGVDAAPARRWLEAWRRTAS
jgi:hypothetical protein